MAGKITKNEFHPSLSQEVDKISVLSENYNVYSSNKDFNGIFTQVDYKRPDGTLYLRSILSGGTSPLYTNNQWTFYKEDGTTIDSTITWTLSYDSDGNATSKVRS